MAMRGPNCVFVGSIPFDTTEQQLIDIFSQVGPVQLFKIVFDKETGKPRGFGFCEYFDAETAKSAIRNLNNYDLRGRLLRVGPTETSALEEKTVKGDNPEYISTAPKSAPITTKAASNVS